jgi:hypothetical protein
MPAYLAAASGPMLLLPVCATPLETEQDRPARQVYPFVAWWDVVGDIRGVGRAQASRLRLANCPVERGFA